MTTTATMEPISIRLETTGYRRFSCFFCGEQSWKEAVQPFVYSGEDRNGVVCRQCLAATPVEFAARIRAQVDDLMMVASTLQALAEELPQRPTLDAFEAAIEKEERAYGRTGHVSESCPNASDGTTDGHTGRTTPS
jgi:hypothetical protein